MNATMTKTINISIDEDTFVNNMADRISDYIRDAISDAIDDATDDGWFYDADDPQLDALRYELWQIVENVCKTNKKEYEPF